MFNIIRRRPPIRHVQLRKRFCVLLLPVKSTGPAASAVIGSKWRTRQDSSNLKDGITGIQIWGSQRVEVPRGISAKETIR